MASPTPPFTPEQALRYARQISLPGMGREGQRRLLGSTVVLVGVGGLGCPAALYLAAAGVGRLVLVDGDRVDASNLHRQVLYASSDVGRPKVEAAAERIRAQNPDVALVLRPERLTAANAREILSGADVVADGSDNFPTRFLVNDACVLLGLPNAHGSIYRYEGQVSFFDGAEGPCYRCLHPEPPPPGLVPTCAEAGVLGILPGVVGTLQATEVVKHLLGLGEGLAGRLLLYDALGMTFRELRLRRDPACPACGPGRADLSLEDLEGYCRAPGDPVPPPAGGVEEAGGGFPLLVEVEEVRDLLAGPGAPFLVDVREDWETGMGMLPGALHIPLGSLPDRWEEIPREGPVVVYCHAGIRSWEAVHFLRSRGLERVASLVGGTDAWSTRVDPALPRY